MENPSLFNEGLLHDKIVRWKKKKKWSAFKEVQLFAMRHILEKQSTDDIVLFAPTAGGKTMAAFIPLISERLENPEKLDSYFILYICPTKALINQQLDSDHDISQLAKLCGLPVNAWTGDIASNKKEASWENPEGILITTPESLEGRLLHKPYDLVRCFGRLRAVIIDELHVYFETERGAQLISLLTRLEAHTRQSVQRIALSATLGDGSDVDTEAVFQFLRPARIDKPLDHAALDFQSNVRIHLKIYQEGKPGEPDDLGKELIARDIAEIFDREEKGIIFTNSRRAAESYTNLLNTKENALSKLPDWKRLPASQEESDNDEQEESPLTIEPGEFVDQSASDRFSSDKPSSDSRRYWPHHGSLDKAIRSHAERRMKFKKINCILVATTTLELGIDVGEIKKVAQIGPGVSVASLRQRLGRSGRPHLDKNQNIISNTVPELFIFLREAKDEGRSHFLNILKLPSFQTLSQIVLLNAGIFESPDFTSFHFSTAVQQLLALIREYREEGITKKELFRILVKQGPFHKLNQPAYKGYDLSLFDALLNRLQTRTPPLIDIDTHQDPDLAEVFLTQDGERFVASFHFTTAFRTPTEYAVKLGKTILAYIGLGYQYGITDRIIVNGKAYEIKDINHITKVIDVKPAQFGNAVYFSGESMLPSTEVIRQMKKLYELEDKEFYEVLSKSLADEGQSQRSIFKNAREVFRRYGLHKYRVIGRFNDQDGIYNEGRHLYWFPWTGDRRLRGLVAALKYAGVAAVPFRICIIIQNTHQSDLKHFKSTILDKLEALEIDLISSEPLARIGGAYGTGKYDYVLSPLFWRQEKNSQFGLLEDLRAHLRNLTDELRKLPD